MTNMLIMLACSSDLCSEVQTCEYHLHSHATKMSRRHFKLNMSKNWFVTSSLPLKTASPSMFPCLWVPQKAPLTCSMARASHSFSPLPLNLFSTATRVVHWNCKPDHTSLCSNLSVPPCVHGIWNTTEKAQHIGLLLPSSIHLAL